MTTAPPLLAYGQINNFRDLLVRPTKIAQTPRQSREASLWIVLREGHHGKPPHAVALLRPRR
jgi:hypothetical protein